MLNKNYFVKSNALGGGNPNKQYDMALAQKLIILTPGWLWHTVLKLDISSKTHTKTFFSALLPFFFSKLYSVE